MLLNKTSIRLYRYLPTLSLPAIPFRGIIAFSLLLRPLILAKLPVLIKIFWAGLFFTVVLLMPVLQKVLTSYYPYRSFPAKAGTVQPGILLNGKPLPTRPIILKLKKATGEMISKQLQ